MLDITLEILNKTHCGLNLMFLLSCDLKGTQFLLNHRVRDRPKKSVEHNLIPLCSFSDSSNGPVELSLLPQGNSVIIIY